MPAHLRADFEKISTSNIAGQEKASQMLAVVEACDPNNQDDRMTVYNMISNVGVFEARAVNAGFYSVIQSAPDCLSEHFSDFQLPRIGSTIPVMTVKQAQSSIDFLKKELTAEKPPVFYYGPYDRVRSCD